RGLQRPGDRPPRGAEDRRAPAEPQPAALQAGDRQHHAAAGDPRRRREMLARRHHRPARREAAFLPALARHRRRRGARPAHLRVRRRDHRQDHGGAAARAARRAAAQPPAHRPAPRARTRPAMSAAASSALFPVYPVERLREDFPILREKIHGHELVYLDNANTTQKPRAVLDAMRHYYEHENSNIHRGTHRLSEIATEKYEGARATVRRFVNAAADREIVFTRGTTEAINLVARSFG